MKVILTGQNTNPQITQKGLLNSLLSHQFLTVDTLLTLVYIYNWCAICIEIE